MSEQNNNDVGSFLAGFVIGALVGAATAIILAPQSGAETRDQLLAMRDQLPISQGDEAHPYRERVSNYLHQAQERAQATTEDIQQQARIVLDEGRSRIAQAKDRLSTPTEDASDEADAPHTDEATA
ncbi:MAG TPA: YtxH domain-containing protein [Anaerolineae bacterium]|nr:YtxH domain-containing protein [Anaerolineae bacterium]